MRIYLFNEVSDVISNGPEDCGFELAHLPNEGEILILNGNRRFEVISRSFHLNTHGADQEVHLTLRSLG